LLALWIAGFIVLASPHHWLFQTAQISGGSWKGGALSFFGNGGPPNYSKSTTSTANPGSITPIFTGTLGVNQTAYDTTYNTSGTDCYTRAWDAASDSGKSIGNNTYSGGDNDIMWSLHSNYVGTTATGTVYILHVNTSGNCGQIINPVPALGVSGPFGFSKVTDTVPGAIFYNLINLHQLYTNTITSDTTYSSTLLVDLTNGTTCPGLPSAAPDSASIMGIKYDDSRFVLALSFTGGQDTAPWEVVWDRTLGCTTMNLSSIGGNWPGGTTAVTKNIDITPTAGNAGGYSFLSPANCTTGASQPSWPQTPGSTVTDGSCTWHNIGLSGSYWTWCTSSCTPTTAPTGSLSSSTTCTNGTNCSCWGALIHDVTFSGDGTTTQATLFDPLGSPTGGACSGLTAGTQYSFWTVGTATTQYGTSAISGLGGLNSGGHNSIGINTIINSVSGAGGAALIRPETNVLTTTQWQTNIWSNHGQWFHNCGGNTNVDSCPILYDTYGLTSTQYAGCAPGSPYEANGCPINLGRAIYAGFPTGSYPPGTPYAIFGHNYGCGSGPTFAECVVATGPNWTASHAYTLNPTVSMVTPTSGNAGNYTFIATVAGTSGGSAPTWTQTAGASVTDGSVTWYNLGVAGSEYPDNNFGCEFGIMSISQDGNWALVASGMLESLGLDSSSNPRCDVFLVHLQ
jgi:hypothetical protein